MDFGDFMSLFSIYLIACLGRYIIHLRQCFIAMSETSNFVHKNSHFTLFFNFLRSVGCPDETCSLMFDILLINDYQSYISDSFLSERETADRNYALGYYMNAHKVK